MEPMSVDRFFTHNGDDVFRCDERQEDMNTKTHRQVNIIEETQNLTFFKQHINPRRQWIFSRA